MPLAMDEASQTLDAWLEKIDNVHYKTVGMGLERVRTVAEHMQLIEWCIPVITVAGTNGKGSTVAALQAIYTQAGYKPGAFTSPHIRDFQERFDIAGEYCQHAEIVKALAHVDAACAATKTQLTFFEYSLLAALWLFKKNNIEVLILEVGLGGELDATNIIDADVAVITSIDFDHTELLGDTREKIAAAKAGIMRRGAIFICGDHQPPRILFTHAQQLQSQAYFINKDFYPYSKACAILPDNAACADQAVKCLAAQLPVSEGVVHEALNNLVVTGRQQQLSINDKQCIIDVAHNPASVGKLADQLALLPKDAKCIGVFAALASKDIFGMLALMQERITTWYLADLSVTKGLHAGGGMLATEIKAQMQTLDYNLCYTFASISDAIAAALAEPEVTHIVIFGSFYTVATALDYFNDLGDV